MKLSYTENLISYYFVGGGYAGYHFYVFDVGHNWGARKPSRNTLITTTLSITSNRVVIDKDCFILFVLE